MAQLAMEALTNVAADPPCVDITSFDAISAAATNWTTAGTNEVLREAAERRESDSAAPSRPFAAADTLALLFAVQVCRCASSWRLLPAFPPSRSLCNPRPLSHLSSLPFMTNGCE